MKIRLLTLFLFFFVVFYAQESKRPVIGLALSGGGAKGVAHVGAIKIIDSLGIKVDYVAGTSMGSIVGGMYAVGYSHDIMKHEMMNADWGSLMSDLPQRRYLSHDEKDAPKRYIFSTSLIGITPYVPSGIISGSKIEAKLNQIFVGYHEDTNFLELPVGFACVAANLNSANKKVFTKGVLPDVIRASMSIPSMFDPYEINGQLYIDGGTMNNFPTDVLREMGCDIIIGVELHAMDDTTSAPTITSVLARTSMFIDHATTKERLELCDIMITPDMSAFGTTSFSEVKPIYEEGVLSARAKMDELVKLAEYLSQWDVEPRKLLQPVDSIYVKSVRITGANNFSENMIMGIFNVEGGSYYRVDELDKELNQLHGTNNFKKAKYVLTNPSKGDSYDLELVVEESPTNTDVGVGIRLDTDFGAQALINITHRSFLFEGSKLGADVIIREHPYLNVYYYFDRGLKPGFGFYSRFYSAKPSFYRNNSYQGVVGLNDWSTALYFQSTRLNRSAIKLGVTFDKSDYNFKEVPNWDLFFQKDKLELLHANAFLRIEHDNLDDSDYPKKGWLILTEAKVHNLLDESFESFDFDPFYIVKGEFVTALSTNSRLTFIPEVYGGITMNDNGANSTIPYYFYAGSLGKNYINNNKSFPGYRFMELSFFESDADNNVERGAYGYARNMATVQLDIRYNIYKKHYLIALGGIGTASQRLENFLRSHHFGGFGLKYSIQSSLGPLEFTVHKSTESRLVLAYFNLGFWF